VGTITQKGEGYWVDVHSVSSGKMSVKPSVVAEVVQKKRPVALRGFSLHEWSRSAWHFERAEEKPRETSPQG
jgi:hypothetical protein